MEDLIAILLEELIDEDVVDIFMLLTEVLEVFFTVVLLLTDFEEVDVMDLVEDTDLLSCEEDEKEEEEVVATDEDPASWPPEGLITKVLMCFSVIFLL